MFAEPRVLVIARCQGHGEFLDEHTEVLYLLHLFGGYILLFAVFGKDLLTQTDEYTKNGIKALALLNRSECETNHLPADERFAFLGQSLGMIIDLLFEWIAGRCALHESEEIRLRFELSSAEEIHHLCELGIREITTNIACLEIK